MFLTVNNIGLLRFGLMVGIGCTVGSVLFSRGGQNFVKTDQIDILVERVQMIPFDRSPIRCPIKIKNRSLYSVEIVGAKTSCYCGTLEGLPLAIGSQSEAEFTLQYIPSKAAEQDTFLNVALFITDVEEPFDFVVHYKERTTVVNP